MYKQRAAENMGGELIITEHKSHNKLYDITNNAMTDQLPSPVAIYK